ncbi:RidA family protein [Dongia rigui]|uniref:Rid family hydrolase n=1 Tax=Dongia rigui TaxID=940149 RepID=A0ABU5E5B0_9PROT|nr:Rid family hydrolase [Dongia rigui]MDY0874252.1 Rid family hydrolase [Dongia rigui]
MATKLETFRLDSLPSVLPFCSALRAGETVYVSGVIGHLPGELQLVPGGLEAEARQALSYMKDALQAAGASLDRVVKCTVYFADMSDFFAFNKIYGAFFGSHQPARSGIAVAGLALGARIEIDCVAVL